MIIRVFKLAKKKFHVINYISVSWSVYIVNFRLNGLEIMFGKRHV